jgi:predicted RNA-binding Zn-ribbon protein involved in translation (DUF1610 family)
MRELQTYRMCPNCGAVGSREHATCDQCGQMTVLKSARALERPKPGR